MNRHPQRPDADEAAMLEHFRRHSDAEPPAELDARILAAARAAAQPRLNAWQRLSHWLFGSPQRWSVALAGVATLGIGLSLTLRNVEPTAPHYDMPAPAAAPAMQRKAAPAAESQALFAAPAAPAASAPQAEERKALAESASVQDQVAPMAKRKAEAAQPNPEPEASLRRLLELQRQGDTKAAQQLRESLRQHFPQLDIDGELQHLQAPTR